MDQIQMRFLEREDTRDLDDNTEVNSSVEYLDSGS